MYSQFARAFQHSEISNYGAIGTNSANEVDALRDQFGGHSFQSGIYRVIASSDVEAFSFRIGSAFPRTLKGVIPLSYDWLGRVFAADLEKPLIYLIEPGSGEVLEMDGTVAEFHNTALASFKEDV